MKLTTFVLSLLLALILSSCVYKTPVQQGNVLMQKDIDEITLGLSKRQVAIILGTPAIADAFNKDRWDYINTFKVKGKIKKIKRYTLYFEDDKLTRTEGNYFPEKSAEIIESN
ncbi:MAG: outer membrane protein assembly factor BamE [Proteobacteria bacterium]|nr:outer membrane protein assembly factor BamE [Pseudomonadota bacterium]